MTTLCMAGYTPVVVPIHRTRPAKSRAAGLAAYTAGQRHGLPKGECLRLQATARVRVMSGECSPAMAITRAESEARQLARVGGAA